jgi:hypothetical protein
LFIKAGGLRARSQPVNRSQGVKGLLSKFASLCLKSLRILPGIRLFYYEIINEVMRQYCHEFIAEALAFKEIIKTNPDRAAEDIADHHGQTLI